MIYNNRLDCKFFHNNNFMLNNLMLLVFCKIIFQTCPVSSYAGSLTKAFLPVFPTFEYYIILPIME